MRLGIYTAATGAEDHSGLPDQRKFSALMPGYRSKLADMLGLRWIATGVPIEEIDKQVQPGDFTLVARTKDGFVYENPRALPRVMLARRAYPIDLDRLIASGVWPEIDTRQSVLVDASMLPQPKSISDAEPRLLPPGTARIVSYRNTEVVIETDSPQGGWVVLNDVWHPRWDVEIDGRPAGQTLRANAIFRAARCRPAR